VGRQREPLRLLAAPPKEKAPRRSRRRGAFVGDRGQGTGDRGQGTARTSARSPSTAASSRPESP
jgi:hypothetical protein